MAQPVIFYYSWKGSTERVAKAVAQKIGGTCRRLEEIKIRRWITGFIGAGYAALRELRADLRPYDREISSSELWIGSPVWAGKVAPAILTLLDDMDLSGKTVNCFIVCGDKNGEKPLSLLKNKIEEKGGRIGKNFFFSSGIKKALWDQQLQALLGKIL